MRYILLALTFLSTGCCHHQDSRTYTIETKTKVERTMDVEGKIIEITTCTGEVRY